MQRRLVNRLEFPSKHVLVCEDDLECQARIAARLAAVFGAQGKVQVSFVPGAMFAPPLIEEHYFDLILLDHDMPCGNGSALMEWLHVNLGAHGPIVAISGILQNNVRLVQMGAFCAWNKEELMQGKHDDRLREWLGER